MTYPKAIAIAGIWIGVGLSAFGAGYATVVIAAIVTEEIAGK